MDFDNNRDTIFNTYGVVSKYEKTKVSYIDRLYNLNLEPIVTEWIIGIIQTNNRKLGKINDNHLYTYIILGYQEKGLSIDPLELAHKLNLKLKKSGINKMLSGTYSTESAVSDLTTSIPIMIIHPKIYIGEILDFVISKTQIGLDKNILTDRIQKFTDFLCDINKFILQETPKNMAAAIVYYYFSLMIQDGKLNKLLFYTPEINDRIFMKSYRIIKACFESSYSKNEELIKSFFIFN